MLNIVIPTLNEEGYIGTLLESLTKQSFKDFDIIVVDANSKDKTVLEAESYSNRLNLKVVQSPTKGVSAQRNYGAQLGNAERILFLDADGILHANFLEGLISGSTKYDVINCWLRPLSKKPVDKVIYNSYNVIFLEFGQYVWPVAAGSNLYSTRKVFNAINGFDEGVKIWEDVDYVKRAVRIGAKFGILRKPKIYTSVRRFELQGRIFYLKENFKALSYAVRYGKMPNKDIASYVMGLDYSKLDPKNKQQQDRYKKLLGRYKSYLNRLKILADKINILE